MPQPRLHADQVDIEDDLVRRLVDDQLPEFRGLAVRHVPSGGTENAVFRLGDELAVRMPLHPGAVGGLLKELRWLPVVAPHVSLPVPEAVAVGEPDDAYPFPWAVVRWLDGEDALGGRVGSRRRMPEALGQFVTELQAIDMTDAPAPGSDGSVRGLPLGDCDETVVESLEECVGLFDVERGRAVWAEAVAAASWVGAPVWLHADLLPGNVLIRDGLVAGVLDFGAMATGDPAYDITPAWHLLDAESRAVFREITRPDDATWARARGLVVSFAAVALPYYLHTNPSMVETSFRGLREALADD